MFRTSQKQSLLSRLPRHKEAVGQEVNGPRWKDTFVKSDTGKEVHPGSQREGVRASVPCGPKGFELPSWPKGCANHGSRAQLKPFSCTLHVFICIYVIIYLFIYIYNAGAKTNPSKSGMFEEPRPHLRGPENRVSNINVRPCSLVEKLGLKLWLVHF